MEQRYFRTNLTVGEPFVGYTVGDKVRVSALPERTRLRRLWDWVTGREPELMMRDYRVLAVSDDGTTVDVG